MSLFLLRQLQIQVIPTCYMFTLSEQFISLTAPGGLQPSEKELFGLLLKGFSGFFNVKRYIYREMTLHLQTSPSPLAHVGLTTVTHPVTSCDFPHFGLETAAANMLQHCISTDQISNLGQRGNITPLPGATSPSHALCRQLKSYLCPTKVSAFVRPLHSTITPYSKG